MAWETRQRGGSYYTRSAREGRRVRRQYVGGGELAVLIARLDTLDRERTQQDRARRREALKAEDDAQHLLRWYCRIVERTLGSELTAAGYHRHKRGEWRKRREIKEGDNGDMGTDVQKAARAELARRAKPGQSLLRAVEQEEAVRAAVVPDTIAERRAVINAAMNGADALEIQALACIRAFPAETVLGWGDPKAPCINLVSPSDSSPRYRVCRAMIEAEYTFMRKQIEGENPTTLEKLLAERVVVLRFQLTNFERTYEAKLSEGLSAEMSDHHMKRLERINRQFLKAVESLAKVRRLQLPNVVVGQMNVADQQVNVAAPQYPG